MILRTSVPLPFLGLTVLVLLLVAKGPTRQDQASQYYAATPKTIVELQQYRQTTSVSLGLRAGTETIATLINLNPGINVWYLLRVGSRDGKSSVAWHIENPSPRESRFFLDAGFTSGIVIAQDRNRHNCELFGASSPNTLERARTSQVAYVPLCGGRVYLRNPVKGRRTALESVTEFLRDEVWGGERAVVLFHHLMADRYREAGELVPESTTARLSSPENKGTDHPLAAAIDPQYANRLVKAWNFGIELHQGSPEKGGMTPGAWYETAADPGIHVSVMQPAFVASAILQSYRSVVNSLDPVEAQSLAYLLAFDTDQFELNYALGTQHPEVRWSDRVTKEMRKPKMPGPDGIGTIEPLVSTGLVRPDNRRRTVASFTGGFKRTHGAFKFGKLASQNQGSHYGFIENGVVLSKLQPGLATVFALDDGSIGMKTWAESDNALLSRIRHARQNGVPIVQFDNSSQTTVPGPLVNLWGPGNWSGSEDEKLRTIRAGLAMQTNHGKRYLIYAVFSDATPSAMARVFQAYRCDYAMLLDMNALEHTYLALYRRSGDELSVDHLLKGMSELDQSASHDSVPRFLGFSDNRDFFYMMRRVTGKAKP